MAFKSIRIPLCAPLLAFLLLMLAAGCSSTRHLGENELLLRRTAVSLQTHESFDKKSELSEALTAAIVQTPNDYTFGLFPLKLYWYNARYARFQRDTAHYQLRARIAQPPVIYDSTAQRRAAQNMRGILHSYGLFYGSVSDTVEVNGKKASVTYRVSTGFSYAVDSLTLDIRNDSIRSVVQRAMATTLLERGSAFQMTTLDLERRRISEAVRNAGYYKFSPENISFRVDTSNSRFIQTSPNIVQAAMQAMQRSLSKGKPLVDIRITVRGDEDPTTLHRFYIANMVVYPDYAGTRDFADSSLLEKNVGAIRYRYHRYWLRENIIHRRIFLQPGGNFSQDDYDRTITQLGELGVFQSVRVFLYDDDTLTVDPDHHPLRCVVLLTPAARYDFNTNLEVSHGSTYTLGSAVSVGLRNRNVGHGANALNLTLSAGVETALRDSGSFPGGLFLRSRNLGANAAIEFPKFIAPVRSSIFRNSAMPRTVVSVGASLLARQDFFTLINYTANYAYNWRQTRTNTWDLTPAFVSVQRLVNSSIRFDSLSGEVPFIENSYRNTFIGGENLTFTFSNSDSRRKFGYSYLRLGAEEAGVLISGVRKVVGLASDSFFQYEQYGKFDFDARHYFTRRRSTIAVRLSGGIGLPYGRSRHLPYIRQYFVGGANSIRGWRVRTLGPGSAAPPTGDEAAFIDRTGDIKLETNAEYRFDILQFFAGAVRIAGATFVDAGNIWLATAEEQELKGGEFRFSKLGSDLAVSSGLGLRFDFGGFITLRLDVGIPLKVPYDRDGDGVVDGWVFDQFNFSGNEESSQWRTNNLIPQIGIGYPF